MAIRNRQGRRVLNDAGKDSALVTVSVPAVTDLESAAGSEVDKGLDGNV